MSLHRLVKRKRKTKRKERGRGRTCSNRLLLLSSLRGIVAGGSLRVVRCPLLLLLAIGFSREVAAGTSSSLFLFFLFFVFSLLLLRNDWNDFENPKKRGFMLKLPFNHSSRGKTFILGIWGKCPKKKPIASFRPKSPCLFAGKRIRTFGNPCLRGFF